MQYFIWWHKIGGKFVRYTGPCYAGMRRAKGITIFRGLITRKDLTDEEFGFYTKFLYSVYPSGSFSHSLYEGEEGYSDNENDILPYSSQVPVPKGTTYIWEIDLVGMEYGKSLAYLLAVRYIQEFPNFVKKFYEKAHNENDSQALWNAFLATQKDINMWGSNHYLVEYQSDLKISLEDFLENLADKKVVSCFSHFKSRHK